MSRKFSKLLPLLRKLPVVEQVHGIAVLATSRRKIVAKARSGRIEPFSPECVFSGVMAGLAPAIHVFLAENPSDADGRNWANYGRVPTGVPE